jgi:hypothetical protein
MGTNLSTCTALFELLEKADPKNRSGVLKDFTSDEKNRVSVCGAGNEYF